MKQEILMKLKFKRSYVAKETIHWDKEKIYRMKGNICNPCIHADNSKEIKLAFKRPKSTFLKRPKACEKKFNISSHQGNVRKPQ